MDTMEFELRDGRKILLIGLASVLTYHSALEGTPEGLSDLYRRRGLETKFAGLGAFANCSAIQVFDPGMSALPQVSCVAYFQMFGAGQPKEVFYSELLVGWFAEELELRSRDILPGLVREVDWDAHAATVLVSDL